MYVLHAYIRLETRRLIHEFLFFHRPFYNDPPLPSYIIDILTDTRQDATGLALRNADSLSTPPIHLVPFTDPIFLLLSANGISSLNHGVPQLLAPILLIKSGNDLGHQRHPQ